MTVTHDRNRVSSIAHLLRRRWVSRLLPLAVVTTIIAVTARTAFIYVQVRASRAITVGSSSQGAASQPEADNSTSYSTTNLGVRVLRPVYAIIPQTPDGRKNVTVVLSVWLKRVGARAAAYDLPQQAQDSIRMMVWVDNPSDIHNRQWGHLKLPMDHTAWKPELLLETAEPGPVLRAKYEPDAESAKRVIDHVLRPYSYRVDVPPGAGRCFKLIEASFPKHKAPVCLAPAREDPTCDWLAPPGRYNASHPALYTTIGAVRHTMSVRDWATYQSHVATRLWNYVTYQVAMGASGLLLYADELQREYLRREPLTGELLRRGHLKLVEWDMYERGHDDDGRGRPLGYNYDQALFASHVNLGLSSCGANLWLIVTDIDEFIYIPKPARTWPEPLRACMETAGPNITIHSLQRFDVLSSTVQPEQERLLWLAPGTLGGGGAAAGNGSSSSFGVHPLELYDRVYAQPLSRMHGKAVVQPASRTVLFFVHDAVPLYGRPQAVDAKCMVLLHVVNFHGGRRKPPPDTHLQPFTNWLFAGPHPNETAAAVEE